ncbi:MAG: type I restriction enzyme subunit R domain-containing protein [Gammaproteobacteria bacterium]
MFCFFLIVANKFQTGFDEPLLHTMFLDKSVSDVNAVQTLSRLNRKHPDKDDTLVVDFSNSYDKIIRAFRKFQNDVETHKDVDPNALSLIYQELLKRDVFTLADIDECNRLFNSENPSDAAPFAGLLADLKKRFEEKHKEKDARREFRALLGKYINLFNYVRSLFRMPQDELTAFYVFAKYLHSALDTYLTYDQLQKEMEHVHLTKHLVREISPKEPEERKKPGGGAGNPFALPPLATVEEIVAAINEKFRQAISPEDANTVEHYLHEVSQDDELIMDVRSNLDADSDVVYDQILKGKLSRRYTDYVIKHAADRYENLNEEDLLGFVQRNAYQLLRQAAQSILGDLG